MIQAVNPVAPKIPEWMVAEMPPGYKTRFDEIERLSAELEEMDGIGCVMWAMGEVLTHAVKALFAALKCDVDSKPGNMPAIAVSLGGSRRLLLIVAGVSSPIQKTNEELTRSFQAVQHAGEKDRVVLVVNSYPTRPPADRPTHILPDALDVLQKMGVNVVTTVTLFRLWRQSLENQQKAHQALDYLYQQDGGQFPRQ